MTWISSLCVDTLILVSIIGAIYIAFKISGIKIIIVREDEDDEDSN